MASAQLLLLFQPNVHLPQNADANLLISFRWVHFVAGITWIGLLYFFNLVNVPFMKELEATTKGEVLPALMSRAMWWFRWSAFVTVLAGLAYWGNIVSSDARNAGTSWGTAIGSFFLIWTAAWAIMYALLIPGKGIFNKGAVLFVLYVIIAAAGAYFYLLWNSAGWESNRLLSIGIGGGLGWVMMLNVWGVIWRIQKRIILWTRENAANGTPIPEKSARMARMAFLASRTNALLSLPMLFFMGAASHYPMFGR